MSNSLFFIHIPKTAGTSIEEVLLKYNYKVGRRYFLSSGSLYKELFNKYKIPLWHIPPQHFNENNNPYNNKILFTVVRNPYTRIISEYRWWFGFKKNIDFGKLTVDHLNEWIGSLSSYDINKDYKINVGHIIPQHIFLQKCDILPKNILKYENNLDEQLNLLIEDLNLKNIQHKCISLGNENNVDNTIPRFRVEDLNMKSIAIINKIYKEDFIKFNYKTL